MGSQLSFRATAAVVLVFAVAMAYLESAVVELAIVPLTAENAPASAGSASTRNVAESTRNTEVREWPWVDIQPSDFTFPANPDALQQGTRTLTPEEAAAVGVQGFENGVMSGVYLRAPDGKVYSLVIRPLLPDETK